MSWFKRNDKSNESSQKIFADLPQGGMFGGRIHCPNTSRGPLPKPDSFKTQSENKSGHEDSRIQTDVTVYFKGDKKPIKILDVFYAKETDRGIEINDSNGYVYHFQWNKFDYYKEHIMEVKQ